MVCRFVEEQECRFHIKGSGQRYSHSPAAGEVFSRPVLRALVQETAVSVVQVSGIVNNSYKIMFEHKLQLFKTNISQKKNYLI